ncbi:MAG: ACT domain-containing protein [Candidatus Omnitrophota bacterium]|nr:ACT domain-containing protein [Candidatus Omnitrophota bacterium]MDZ4242984.1 ACT domain-containing protein [Candidatus Omnitrophota bacterium]
MTQAVKSKQLIITVNNKVGTLAEVTHILSSSAINIMAICAYAVDNRGVIMFVAEDHDHAKKLLKAKGYDIREEDVVLVNVENKPGTLQSVTQKISDIGVDINLLYGSVDKKGKVTRIVLIAEDNETVLTALKV